MPYIKMKKLWKKDDDLKKLADQLFDLTKKMSPVKNWDDTDFVEAVVEFGQFVHPETDVSDDSEGIQPKQLKELHELLKKDTFDVLEKIIDILNSYVPRNLFTNYISDGFISWKQVFKNIVIPNLKENKKNLAIGKIMYDLNPTLKRFNSISNDVLELLGSGKITEDRVITAINENKVDFNQLDLDVLDNTIFLTKRKALWEKEKGRAPQAEIMLNVNPHNFHPDLIEVVNNLYGTRQIAKLSEKEQYHVAVLIDTFGLNLLSIPVEVLKTNYSSLSFGNNNIDDYRLVFDKVFKDLNKENINITFVNNLISVFPKYPLLKDFILKQQDIKDKNLEVILYITNMFNSITNQQVLRTLSSLDPVFFRIFMRYRVVNVNDISTLMNLYNEAQKVKTTIPLIQGTIGKYTYVMIDKSDPLGLILGYATDCCQVIGNAGQECLFDGYLNPNSSFFAVLKDDRVYAQSWVWTTERTNYGTGLCFDSLEILGKNVDHSPEILECYKEAAKKLNETYDVVYVGADGACMPKGMNKLGTRLSIDEIYDLNLNNPNRNLYSDLTRDQGGCFILEKKG